MTKIIYLIITATTIVLSCTALMAQTDKWKTPNIVEVGKELPRSKIIPYDTKENALVLSKVSKYMELISDEWTMQESSTYVEYSAKFKRPFLWVNRAVILRIESATRAYEVFVNGTEIGYNQSSSTTAEFDITKMTNTGANKLTIKIFKNSASNIIESRGTLKTTPSIGQVYISSPPKVMIRDFTANTSVNEMHNGIIELGAIMKSQLLNSRNIKLFYELYSPEGELISNGSRDADFDMRREDTIRFLINVPNAKLWSHETPNLYTIILSTQHEGRFTEYVNIKSGFRTLSVVKDKVSINGNEVKLAIKEYYAANDSVKLCSDLKAIKESGYNTIKVKANPQSSYFYELCDQIGLYVCNQADINTSVTGKSIAKAGNASNNPVWEDSFVDRVLTMYHSSKNHPSVIMFSMAENSTNGYNLYESFLALKKLEHIRPIVYVDAKGEWNSDAIDIKDNSANKHDRIVLGEHGKSAIPEEVITVTDIDLSNGKFTVKNNYSLTPLYVNATYLVKKGRKVYAEGQIPLSISPNSSKSFEIPFGIMSKDVKLKVKFSIDQVKQVSTDYVIIPANNNEEEKKLIHLNIFKPKEVITNPIEELYTKEYEVISAK